MGIAVVISSYTALMKSSLKLYPFLAAGRQVHALAVISAVASLNALFILGFGPPRQLLGRLPSPTRF